MDAARVITEPISGAMPEDLGAVTSAAPEPVVAPDGFYSRIGKPVFDRVVAGFLLVLLVPVLLVVGVAVGIALGWPVFYRQERVGRDGRVFRVLKFRTMRTDRRTVRRPVIEDRRRFHKTEADPRHTATGRRLRRWSLDELPQLWNVVCGDMSLVGPRPELVDVVARYEPWQHQRHLVRPGITGLWQVTRRGDVRMELATDTDLEYVATMSFRRDLWILLRTVPAAVSRQGT